MCTDVRKHLFRWASYATSVLASLQIQFLSFVYSRVVRRLNDFENYRTETAYENNLIFKTFLFQVWRGVALLLYIALPPCCWHVFFFRCR